jgi:YD repeat-containing protein
MRLIHFGYRFLLTIAVALIGVSSGEADASVLYTYDSVGRIATALYDNGACVTYSYDAFGNQTARTVVVNGVSPVWGSGAFACFPWSS